jgi:CheY-like chemotaxis protein
MMQAIVIDDQGTFRWAVSRILRRYAFAIHEAADGEAGLAELAARPDADLVMVDWRMPGIGGLEVVMRIRSDRRFARARVVMVTGLDDGASEDIAMVAGAHGFLVKPFTERALVAQLDALGLGPSVRASARVA